ncbi:NAD-P-binding protein [Stereum hirsutum FP-91666 SS1]|uniref:NAD-P-binding protein n=1 Tax=Stereum hirsutum (strain FP-91666) TaxID=721885 RepID=UPI000444A432|nr:NAD-P-binding protein [Stereum hirsutum FP-91666 SS1]EIM82216.1 NAD-P-binding protein [Stereum hirsutum FP-91666 SS1]
MSHGVVLVTGITGFIATHTAKAFLEAGYTVKGTARSAGKAEEWISLFPAFKSKFQYAVVEDMIAPGAFDEAIKGCDIVAHIASPAHWNHTDNEKDILIPAIQGTRNLVEATRLEPRIKRVVFTSSFASIVDPAAPPDHVHKSEDWNPVTYEEAKASSTPAFVYRSSKPLAERAFWDYIKEEKPAWEGSAICPCGTFGPPIHPLKSMSALNTSIQYFWNMANGTFKSGVPAVGFPVFVDVRDVALAHVRAVELDAAKGQRYLLIGGTYKPELFVDVMGRTHPELKADKLAEVDVSKVKLDTSFKYDNSKAQKDLNLTFTSLDKMVADTLDRLLLLEKELPK